MLTLSTKQLVTIVSFYLTEIGRTDTLEIELSTTTKQTFNGNYDDFDL